jgi:hypothetical protein
MSHPMASPLLDPIGSGGTVHEFVRPCSCPFRSLARLHHDHLLRLETDPDAVVDLFELAVTWGELEYVNHVEPNRWLEFVAAHRWTDQARVERIVGLAFDAALRARRPAPLASSV